MCLVCGSPVLLQYVEEVCGSCSHVQKHGQAEGGCQLKMALEPLVLDLLAAKLQSGHTGVST